MQKDNVIESDYDIFFDNIYQNLIEKYPFDITHVDEKLVLKNRRVKLVQLNDNKEDRSLYNFLILDYYDLQKQKGIKIDLEKIDLNENFSCECLHYNHNNFPMFVGYNSKNEIVGMFGFRRSIDVNINNTNITLQEISIRTKSDKKVGLSFYGMASFFMLYAYAMLNKQHIFMETFPFLRDTMFHVIDLCEYEYYTTKNMFINVFNCTSLFDIWSSLRKDKFTTNIINKI